MAGWPFHKFEAIKRAYRYEAERMKRAIARAKGEDTWTDWNERSFERPR